ncbi:MAG: SMP-30/gluconolactonase/LRE family protein [Gemmataceae bacterium]|nr:SMP-30/gluconolactonase/LRE family protein [Gemmataceae bacterium]
MRRFCFALIVLCSTAPAFAQDMPLSQVLIDGEGWKLISKDFRAISSLAVDRAGDIYVADPDSKVIRLQPDGKVAVTMGPKETRAVVVAPCRVVNGQESLLCAVNKDGNGTIEAFTSASSDKGGISYQVAKDLVVQSFVVAKNGTVYCTVPGEQVVYALSKGEKRKVAEGIGKPTGLALLPDGGTLIVADAAGKHLYAYRVEKDGSLTCKEGYYTMRLPAMQKASGAGGMTMDSAGRLYVATTVGVQCYDPTGRLNGVLLNPPGASLPPTAVVFGGPDHDTLYVACGDKLFARKTKAKGVVAAK